MRRVIAFLCLVELTSGILQGYYAPTLTDIARHLGIHDADVNWFEAAQLMVSALAVPVLAKLGDMYGHRKILLVSTLVTAVASCGVALAPDFWTFLAAWSFQGVYVVWLPLEIALIFSRLHQLPDGAARTRRAAGILVGALEFGVIAGALAAGALVEAFAGQLQLVLLVPAVAVTACGVVIRCGVPESLERSGGRVDTRGFALLAGGLLLITSGLTFMRLNGPGTWWPWALVAAGLVAFIPFMRFELGQSDPLVDIRMLRGKSMWPVQLTAGLFGVSVLGAQAPLSTFARTDPSLHGYGLGLRAGQVSIIIGGYVLALLVGALLYPLVTRRLTPRWTLVCAAGLVGVGYLLFLPFHGSLAEALVNMAVAGGAFASAVFGIALLSHVLAEAGTAASTAGQTAAPLAGYLTVWTICGLTGLMAAAALVLVPRLAFSDPARVLTEAVPAPAGPQ